MTDSLKNKVQTQAHTMISKEVVSVYTFQFQLTDDDYFEFSLCHNYSLPKYRKKLMTQRYLFPSLYMICVILIGLRNYYYSGYYIPLIAISVGWIVFHRKLIERNIRKSIKTIKESGKAPYADDFKALFEEEKLLTSTKDTVVSTAYLAIEKIVIGKNALYLYKNAISAFILPYRIFVSEEEKEVFLQFIKQKTNAAVLAGVTK